jgi:hypothetical protein
VRAVHGAQAQCLWLLTDVKLDWRDQEWGDMHGTRVMEPCKHEISSPAQVRYMIFIPYQQAGQHHVLACPSCCSIHAAFV